MGGFNVVHDLLDMQLLDRRQAKMGRVDELVLELRDGAPPRIAAILVGSPARSARVGHWRVALGRFLRRVARMRPAAVTRIPFAAVHVIGKQIEVDVDGIETAAMRAERRLRDSIRHIPGAERKEERQP